MTPVRIGIVAEDRNFADFLRPAIRSLAQSARCDVTIARPDSTRGCRTDALTQHVASACEASDVVVVGIDASAPGHRTRARSHRQKAAHVRPFLADAEKVSLAIAAPCVEAWLMADPAAFGRGLLAATGTAFRAPAAWPAPADESTAKQQLGAVVAAGLDGLLLRCGFEYTDEIVREMDLLGSTNASLADWSREFHARLTELQRAR